MNSFKSKNTRAHSQLLLRGIKNDLAIFKRSVVLKDGHKINLSAKFRPEIMQ